MPLPLSSTVTRTPFRSGSVARLDSYTWSRRRPAIRHAVNGVGHEIGEDLAKFARKSTYGAMSFEPLGDVDAGHLNLWRVQGEDALQDLDEVDLHRRLSLAMKCQ